MKSKPWYFVNGTRYPAPAIVCTKTGKRNVKLLPSEDMENDRFMSQMMFVPPNYKLIRDSGKLKTILMYFGIPYWWSEKAGSQAFKDLKCPVDTCRMTTDRKERSTADMVFFHDQYEPTNETRPLRQINALYQMEVNQENYWVFCLWLFFKTNHLFLIFPVESPFLTNTIRFSGSFCKNSHHFFYKPFF